MRTDRCVSMRQKVPKEKEIEAPRRIFFFISPARNTPFETGAEVIYFSKGFIHLRCQILILFLQEWVLRFPHIHNNNQKRKKKEKKRRCLKKPFTTETKSLLYSCFVLYPPPCFFSCFFLVPSPTTLSFFTFLSIFPEPSDQSS